MTISQITSTICSRRLADGKRARSRRDGLDLARPHADLATRFHGKSGACPSPHLHSRVSETEHQTMHNQTANSFSDPYQAQAASMFGHQTTGYAQATTNLPQAPFAMRTLERLDATISQINAALGNTESVAYRLFGPDGAEAKPDGARVTAEHFAALLDDKLDTIGQLTDRLNAVTMRLNNRL